MSGYSTNANISNDIPNQYLCPISLCIMSDPVICQDGYTYDRVSILSLKKPLSPMTRQPIDLKVLIPNIAIRQLIEQYASTNGIKLNKHINTTYQPQSQPQTQPQTQVQNTQPPVQNTQPQVQNTQQQPHTQSNQRTNQDILRNLQSDCEDMLARFEHEQREQMEDNKLERIVTMFNTNDNTLFTNWKIFY